MTAPPSPAVAAVWRAGGRDLPLGRAPLLMGIVNVTPDSFSDGGRWLEPAAAVERGLAMVEEGAALLDVGGESTRPGAEPVEVAEELDRIGPVIEALAGRSGVPVSVDTTKLEVARGALDAGASIVNDVSALRFSPGIAALAAERGAGLVLMHMRGDPRTMQEDPRYADLHGEIGDALEAAALRAEAAGVPRGSILVDPGIGFGKSLVDNWRLIAGVGGLAARGWPVLIGHSRKSFTDPARRRPPAERLPESLAAGVLAAVEGAAVLRVHDVEAHARALEMVDHWREARAADGEEGAP
ncbi:MAG TPA: dihydropteroate synthase [Gemmatimonadota bacterium]|nr:dihydropteroate synthase [Gemmatimonadota bacterium]